MIKKLLVIMMLLMLTVLFSQTIFNSTDKVDSYSRDYYVKNTYSDTGSKNIVTGIYLDYRVFDSIFEAGILLIVATGIIFMEKKDDEVR